MIRILNTLIPLAIVLITSGCANLTTYNKEIDLRGKSVSMDVKQRVVFSQNRESFDHANPPNKITNVVTCAEPSPDALTVLGASGALSFSDSISGKAANAGAAFAESGAFVGLRTQSIQLLRDAMYRLCESYAAGAVTADDYAGMQRRYQSTMMGLIAIEQLTGPVKAAQVALTSSAASSAGAGGDDAAVKSAQARVDTKRAELVDAQGVDDTAKSDLDKAQASLKTNQQAQADARKAKEPVSALEEAQVSLKADLDSKKLAKADAERKVKLAEKTVREAEFDLAKAKSSVTSSAGGSGQISAYASAVSATTKELTEAVGDIVKEINKAYTKDACFALITRLANNPLTVEALTKSRNPKEKEKESVAEVLLGMCTQVMLAETEIAHMIATERIDAAKARRAKADRKIDAGENQQSDAPVVPAGPKPDATSKK